MREALGSPEYFSAYLSGESWSVWRALLIAVMGEALTENERLLFKSVTGRDTEPGEPVREFWGIIGRRGGKSRATAVLGSYLAACCDHRSVLAPGEVGILPILAASTRQAQQLFNFISGIFATVPHFQGLLNESTGDTLRLKTGVNVVVAPASWRTIRSITAISAIADEIAFWRDDNSVNPDEEIIGALKPALLTTGGMFVGISSPYAQRGELYKAFRQHYGQSGDPRKLVAKAASLTMNPSLPKAEIDLAYEEDPSKASAEYGGEFRTDVEQFIAREVIEGAILKGVVELPPEPGTQYRAFVDPSGGRSDSMTIAIAHHEGTRAILDAVRERKAPFSPESVVTEFASLLRRYGLRSVTGDRYGAEFVEEAFRRHGITYKAAEQPKSSIYLELLPKLNSGEVQLLNIPTLINQLATLERRTTRGGKDSIDHAPGAHDDLANAAAGALVAKRFQLPIASSMSFAEAAGRLRGHELYASKPPEHWAKVGLFR